MTKVAIIGTAGRDRTKPMNISLWHWMVADAMTRIKPTDTLVSGGAAWADHLAVELFLRGKAAALKLYLPAPIENGWFLGPYKSAASAANFYHGDFSAVIGHHSIGEIVLAAQKETCTGTCEPVAAGYGAMFVRNNKVAKDCEILLAYTFGEGDVPADGGTKDTWDKATQAERIHISLPYL